MELALAWSWCDNNSTFILKGRNIITYLFYEVQWIVTDWAVRLLLDN